MEPVYKRSQRPTWSCRECSRRKIRCDKRLPCDQCTKRGQADRCTLDFGDSSSSSSSSSAAAAAAAAPNVTQPLPAGRDSSAMASPVPSQEILSVVFALQRRVDELERRLARVEEPDGHSRSTALSPAAKGKKRARTTSLINGQGNEEEGVTMEYLALGKDRGKKVMEGGETVRPPSAPSPPRRRNIFVRAHPDNILKNPRPRAMPPDIVEMLLPGRTLEYVMAFARDAVQWQHAVVHSSTFRRETEAFLSLSEADKWIWVDPLWLGLLFAIQSVAVHQMPDFEATLSSLVEQDRRMNRLEPRHQALILDDTMPQRLLDAALRCLEVGRYLSEPSFYTCQAIAVPRCVRTQHRHRFQHPCLAPRHRRQDCSDAQPAPPRDRRAPSRV